MPVYRLFVLSLLRVLGHPFLEFGSLLLSLFHRYGLYCFFRVDEIQFSLCSFHRDIPSASLPLTSGRNLDTRFTNVGKVIHCISISHANVPYFAVDIRV